MCGIAGFIDKKKKDEKKKIIKEMCDYIKHRGPDGEGYYIDDKLALGHRRLSIVDIKLGTQPMFNEDKTIVIVFNGEIYNHEELRKKLERKHTFKTKCDTEVLLHGYEEWGIEVLLKKLVGMFAFVIYDKNQGKIFGARDHFGIKPFYYYNNGHEFFFASEIKAFLGHPNFEKKVNKQALKMFLIFQYSVHEETFFENVYKLKPGHYFEYSENQVQIKPFFEVNYPKCKKVKEEIKVELNELLENSIKYHQMNSDVEVGSYLSGGVDSSYVVSVAKPDKTFSVGFNVNGFDESLYAKELSDLLHIKNYRKLISADEFFEALPIVEYHTDEPEANLSAVPLYYLSKLASDQVKVVLSGEGSDEMFGGYNEYYEPTILKIYACIPLIIRKGIRNFVRLFPHFPGQNTLIKYGLPFEERYIGHGTLMEEWEANEILADNLKNNEMICDVLKPVYNKVKKERLLTKKIFREIADKKIPEEWAKRRKLGFPVPFSKWILEEKYYNKVKEIFSKEYVEEFFDKNVINRLLEEHYNKKKNNGRKIYNIYTFLIWYKVYFIDTKRA